NALNDPKTGKDAQAFLPSYAGYPVLLALGVSNTAPTASPVNFQSSQVIGGGSTSSYLDTTVLWTYGDSLSWSKGKHAFKMGGEIRRGNSLGYDAGIAPTTVPRAIGGDAPGAPITAITAANFAGLAGTTTAGNILTMRNMLSFLAGSLGSVTQLKFMEDPTKTSAYEDYKTFPWRIRDFHSNEASLFF